VVEKLDAGDATAFSPTIAALDGLVESITFQAIPVREPALPSLPDPSASTAG
jgi:hypothetical protein